MPESDHLQLARDLYGAYAAGDRGVVERMLSEAYAATGNSASHVAGMKAGTGPG